MGMDGSHMLFTPPHHHLVYSKTCGYWRAICHTMTYSACRGLRNHSQTPARSCMCWRHGSCLFRTFILVNALALGGIQSSMCALYIVCVCACALVFVVCVCSCACALVRVCVCVCIVRACAWCVCVVQCILACVTYLAPHQPLPFSSPSTILSTHRSFGAVYAGTFRGDPVAIKTLKSNMRSHMRDEFFQEADIMKYNDKDWGREEVALHAVVVRTNGGQLLACFCERSVPWLRVNTGRHRQTHRHFVHALCWTVPVSAVSEHSSTPMFLGLLVL